MARYQANHVVWFLAGDGNFSEESGARWRRIGRGVFGGRWQEPVRIHPQGRQWFFGEFADEEWLDVIIYQSRNVSRTSPTPRKGISVRRNPKRVIWLWSIFHGVAR